MEYFVRLTRTSSATNQFDCQERLYTDLKGAKMVS